MTCHSESVCPKCLKGGTGPHPSTCTVTDRFWTKVQKGEGCWNWIGASNEKRYGQIQVGAGRRQSAHRYSYEIHFGPIADGLYVCHKCDNTLCVRPDHLFLGTQRENIGDMIQKGRGWWHATV